MTWAWASDPKLLARIEASGRLVLVVGGRLSEVPSQGYELFDVPRLRSPWCMCMPMRMNWASCIAHLSIHATPQAFAAALNSVHPAAPVPSTPRRRMPSTWPGVTRHHPHPGNLQNGQGDQTPEDAARRAPSSAMARATLPPGFTASGLSPTTRASSHPPVGRSGYGLPAGVGGKRLWPQREVMVFAGDGDFLMHGQEFEPPVQYGLPIIVVLLDNAMYGTIRMHQERDYPGASAPRSSRTPTSRPMPRPSAATASAWSARKTLLRPSPAPAPAACPACCTA